MLLEVAFVKEPLVKLRVMVVATLWDKFVNVATPPTLLAVRVPWSVPVPALRTAVMTSPLVLTRLPAASVT
jgi:hypothetical protein